MKIGTAAVGESRLIISIRQRLAIAGKSQFLHCNILKREDPKNDCVHSLLYLWRCFENLRSVKFENCICVPICGIQPIPCNIFRGNVFSFDRLIRPAVAVNTTWETAPYRFCDESQSQYPFRFLFCFNMQFLVMVSCTKRLLFFILFIVYFQT